MITAHQARLETQKYTITASAQHTMDCIKRIEESINRSISMGYYEAPIDMWTKEALDHFIKLEFTFRTTQNGILMINWDSR